MPGIMLRIVSPVGSNCFPFRGPQALSSTLSSPHHSMIQLAGSLTKRGSILCQETTACFSLYPGLWHTAHKPVGTQLMLMNEFINE